MKPKEIGFESEVKAVEFLKKNGFINIKRHKTIDFQCERKDIICYVEVKTKTPHIGFSKRQYAFLKRNNGFVIIVDKTIEMYNFVDFVEKFKWRIYTKNNILFACKKCGKITTSTNETVLKLRLCFTCRISNKYSED